MIAALRHILGRTFVKLGGQVNFVPITEEPIGGSYSVTVEQDGFYYLGHCGLGENIHDKWLLPTCVVWASPERRKACLIELGADGTLLLNNEAK